MLGMAYIRVYEIATFYTQFQLAPVGKKAHVQVCGTTPCMLRGAEALKDVCRNRIHEKTHHLSADGAFSWEEVECAGACANAPMVQIFADTFEDLTPEALERILDGYAAGRKPQAGSQAGRKASEPQGGASTLKDGTLYDGSVAGAWKAAFEERETKRMAAERATAEKAAAPIAAAPASVTAAASANAAVAATTAPAAITATAAAPASKPVDKGPGVRPSALASPRDGKPDDLKLLWGVAEKLEKKLNEHGIWHFDQIARWTPLECIWIEAHIDGMDGRIARDRWLEQAAKLAAGWRPDAIHGQRPKG
jgi:NADH-quinone oxidoreductase subunit E